MFTSVIELCVVQNGYILHVQEAGEDRRKSEVRALIHPPRKTFLLMADIDCPLVFSLLFLSLTASNTMWMSGVLVYFIWLQVD